MAASVFTDFSLPSATSWFYLSLLLAVALFFKFSRLLSVRNWDVLTLFLLMPGFLILAEGSGYQFWGYLWLLAASCGWAVRSSSASSPSLSASRRSRPSPGSHRHRWASSAPVAQPFSETA